MNLDDILGISDIEQGKTTSFDNVVNLTSSNIRENMENSEPLNMGVEPNTPFNDILNDTNYNPKQEENMYINNENNPLNIPMTRAEIINQKEKEEEPKEEISNSSGYFGGPIDPKTEDEFLMSHTSVNDIEG